MKKYPIHEMFHAFQGEGDHAGLSALFIRMFGCPVRCPWCDSAGTWHPRWVPSHVERHEVSRLVDAAIAACPQFVVLTGGEPCVHDLKPLVDALKGAAIPVHVETCGAFECCDGVDWITVSPKRDRVPLPSMLSRAAELKIIVDHPDAIEEWLERLCLIHPAFEDEWLDPSGSRSVWLHPEWSQRGNAEVLDAISNAVKSSSGRMRAGWQLHKLYKVDALDARAAKPAPLGGDESKGF